MALASSEKENTQHFMNRWVRIAAHAAVIHNYEQLGSMFIAAQLLRHVDEVSGTPVVGSDDLKSITAAPLISGIGVELEIDVGVFGKAKLFDAAVPVPDADEEFFYMIARRIDAHVAVVHIKLQHTIVQKCANLWSYIHAAVACAIFGRHQLAALRDGRAGKKKHACQSTDYSHKKPLPHGRPFRLIPR